jgi:hypothetical protein
MNAEAYDDMALEQNAKTLFGFRCDVQQVILRDAPVSYTARATVFLTEKKELMVYIDGESRMTLGDIKKFITRMGMTPELMLPPKGQTDYFNEIARERFFGVYPGRRHPSESDLQYYKTLAPYKPALIQIEKVKNGEIYQFDTDSKGDWRLATKFAYRRIQTS